MNHRAVLPLAAFALAATVQTAHAWSIGNQLNPEGCHEQITAEALRRARVLHPTAPRIAPTRDEAAMIADVIFAPPADLVDDLAGMSLLLGVRSNDVKDTDPVETFDIIQVHGNPVTQPEHCIRRGEDDGSAGDEGALAACRAFIHDTAAAALDGLAADGTVDAGRRIPLAFYVQFAGHIEPELPLFYVKMGSAMHALEDGFTHVFRTADGARVTTVTNWIEFSTQDYDEGRDGPGHVLALDDCRNTDDPIIARNRRLATDAATELLAIALDPALTREAKLAAIDALTAKALAYEPGCTLANDWCDPDETRVKGMLGCNAGGGGSLVLALGALVPIALGGRRRRAAMTAAACALLVAVASPARADDLDGGKTAAGDTGTWAVTGSVGGAVERAAALGTVGVRYRLSDSWLLGADVAWNPWIATSPLHARAGSLNYYATLVRRFPMKYERVNLRTSLHLGGSTLLFDVYGAPKYSTGAYGAISFLGIDVDLGGKTRLVIDPMELAIPVPKIGQIPLWYEQYRFVIGLQIGI